MGARAFKTYSEYGRDIPNTNPYRDIEPNWENILIRIAHFGEMVADQDELNCKIEMMESGVANGSRPKNPSLEEILDSYYSIERNIRALGQIPRHCPEWFREINDPNGKSEQNATQIIESFLRGENTLEDQIQGATPTTVRQLSIRCNHAHIVLAVMGGCQPILPPIHTKPKKDMMRELLIDDWNNHLRDTSRL